MVIVNLAKALSLISILLIVCNANESSPTQREGLFPLGDFTFTFESSSLQVTLLADEPMLNSQNVLTQSALIASSSEIYAPDMQLDTTSSCASSLLQERLSLDTTFIQVTLTTGSSNLLTPRKCQHQQSSSVYELEVQREELGTLWGIIRQILKTELGTSHRAFVYFLKPHARQMTTCPEYSFLSGGICIACSVGCTTCTSITACSVCFPGDATAVGYYLASSACVQCASQCLTCDSTHLPCKTCLPGFYINAGNCSPCPLFATACTSTAVTTCQDGFMPSGNSCVPCGVGCATCTSNTACTQCYSSYNLVAGACNSCLPNCGVCSSTLGSCTTCVDGYVWVSPVCVQCPEYCATCSSAACLTCVAGSYLSSGACLTCNHNCDTCTSSTCTTCAVGFFPNPTVGSTDCKPCSMGCGVCIDQNTCLQCSQGYLSNGICLQCPPGCQSCLSTGCYACAAGSFLSTTDQKCYLCMPNCDQCHVSGSCDLCSDGFNWDSPSNSCKPCKTGCLHCNTNANQDCFVCTPAYFLDNPSAQCKNCMPGCDVCSSNTACTTCSHSYYYDSTRAVCRQCLPGCASCTGASTCNTCMSAFFKDPNGICNSCPQNCASCVSGTTCAICAQGFFTNSNGQCQPCLLNCDQCPGTTTCYTCHQGTYLDSNWQCSNCGFGCANCMDATHCSTCQAGFYLNNGVCTQCLPNCQNCFNSNTCNQCNDGFYQTATGCAPCAQNCVHCLGLSSCQSCVVQYFANPLGQCTLCTAGCDLCNTPSSCQVCTEGNYLTPTQTCQQCATGCAACSTPTTCDKCLLGFTNTPNGCQPCAINCLNCDGSAGCRLCSDSYYTVPSTANNAINVCAACTPGCVGCTSTTCLVCKQGMYATGANCNLCPSNCNVCSSSTVCQNCAPGYNLNSTNQCAPCSSNCASCSSTACNQCTPGYQLTTLGTCSGCTTNCLSCSSTACLQCQNGFYLTTAGLCTVCPNNCQICDSTGCLVCNNGRYPDSTKTCQLCSDKCTICNSAANCVACQTGFYLNVVDGSNAACQQCHFMNCLSCTISACTICASGFFLDAPTGTCKPCVPGCPVCTDGSSCSVCPTGFFANAGKCAPCNLNCASCYLDGSNNNLCNFCVDNFYLDSSTNSCKQCSANCVTCSSSTACSTCGTNYYVNDQKACQNCVPNCATCTNGNSCSQCFAGYYFDSIQRACVTCADPLCASCTATGCVTCDAGLFTNSTGSCVNCSPNCGSCNSLAACYGCNPGYFVEPADGQCKSCPNKIPNCNLCDNASTCKSCMAGFSVTPSGGCAQCPSNCFSCTNTGCAQCNPGYFVSGNSCTACSTNCNTCTSGSVCTVCNNQYALVSNACVVCTDANCLTCSPAATCTSCLAGYYVNSAACTACGLANCNSCNTYTSGGTTTVRCTICAPGFYVDQTAFTCSPCTFSNCATCSTPVRCDNCLVGYSKNQFQQCAACPPFCSVCDLQGRCMQCAKGFFPSQGLCLACAPSCGKCQVYQACQECVAPFYLDQTNKCEPCPNNCTSCLNPSQCLGCSSGYFLNTLGTCSPCLAGCAACASATTCNSCANGYFSKGGVCTVCTVAQCKTCTSDPTCASCLPGNYVNTTSNTCNNCISNCTTCSNSTNCATCQDGFFRVPGTLATNFVDSCSPCKSTCQTCSAYSTCLTCPQGSQLSGTTCASCIPGCATCTSTSGTCTNCMLGFFQQTDGTCGACATNCQNCTSTGSCNSCTNGFYANSVGVCTACITGCNSCLNSTSCFNCGPGYFLSSGVCTACSTGCGNCNSASTCSRCLPGFLPVNQQCQGCSNVTIVNTFIPSDFSSVVVVFQSPPDMKNVNCSQAFRTEDNLGVNPTCSVSGNNFTMLFGQGYFFNDQSHFNIDFNALFNFPCQNGQIANLTSSYNAPPPSPSGNATGILTFSIGCSAQNLTYQVNGGGGNNNQSLVPIWSATMNPNNSALVAYINSTNTTRLDISPSLFAGVGGVLDVYLSLCNVLKICTNSSFETVVTTNKQLLVVIDRGTEITIDPSQDITFIAKVTDSCGTAGNLTFNWTLVNTTQANFNASFLATQQPPNNLRINGRTLAPNNTYQFAITVANGDLTGTASILVHTSITPPIARINRGNGNIGTVIDLNLDGHASWDPTNPNGTLAYTWVCYTPTGTTCANANNSALITVYNQENLTIPAASLVGGAVLNIILWVTTSDGRSASQNISLTVVSGLSTNIDIQFDQLIVEPSLALSISADITSQSNFSIVWTGTPDITFASTLPTLLIPPHTLARGVNYTLTIQATEITSTTAGAGAVSTATVSFYTNMLPYCLDAITVSPSSGVALSTSFTTSISSCSDADSSDSLTYTYGSIDNGINFPLRSGSLNSFTNQMPAGNNTVYIEVCDSDWGCVAYYTSISVDPAANSLRLLTTDTLLVQYAADTTDMEDVPLYAVAFLKTYSLTLVEITYIYDSVLTYISYKTIDGTIVDIMLSVVTQIFNSLQEPVLTQTFVSSVLDMTYEIMYNSTDSLTSDEVDLAYSISLEVVDNSKYDPNYSYLANNFIQQVLSLYSYSLLPGNTAINEQSSTFSIYKHKDVASAYSNTSYTLGDGSVVQITSLPFASSDIVNLLINVYPQALEYSDIIDITFSSSGTYSNNVLNTTSEVVTPLTTATVSITFSIYNNASSWACQYYDGSAWVESGCTITSVQANNVTALISHTSMFRVSESTGAADGTHNGPVYIAGILVLILVVLYSIFYFVDRTASMKPVHAQHGPVVEVVSEKGKVDDNSMVNDLDMTYKDTRIQEVAARPASRSIFEYHLLFGLLKFSNEYPRVDKILCICVLAIAQLAIEGAIIGYDVLNSSYMSRNIEVGIIAVALTIPIKVIFRRGNRQLLRGASIVLTILGFITFFAGVALVIAISNLLTYGRHTQWVISFFWGLLFEFSLMTIISIPLCLFRKSKV